MAYTTIDDPSAHFQAATWTGTGSAGNAVTFDGNSDMQPDWVWSKRRDAGYSHVLKDTSRGGTSNNDQHLVSNLGNAESTYTNYRMDFNSDGFTADAQGDQGFNVSGSSMISWCWKANGGTTSSNTDGNSTTTVQANTTAGFSIVLGSFTGSTKTYGHGLGVAPDVVMWKNRSNTNAWLLFTTVVDGTHDYGIPSQRNNFSATSYDVPTSTVFYGNDDASTNFVAYCFAQKQGFSKFGSFVGNGSTEGPFVYTGFKPAWLMIKNTAVTNTRWRIIDGTKINPTNVTDTQLFMEDDLAENTNSVHNIDLLSNGFKIRTSQSDQNNSGSNIFYMAFAENPFVTSKGTPTTAR